MHEHDERTGQHELTIEQDAELKSCANHAIAWGVVCLVAALICLSLAAAAAGGRNVSGGLRLYLPAGLLELALGINFCRAGLDFRDAVATRGRDMAHVMKGLSHLSSAVLVQIILAIVTLVLVAASAAFVGVGR